MKCTLTVLVAGLDQRVATEQRVERLEGTLRPLFNVLPKDFSGRLGFGGVLGVLQTCDGGAW